MYLYLPTFARSSRVESEKYEYGIAGYKNFRKVVFAPNVAKFSFVLCLCINCTLHQLSNVHLFDVLEDCLSNTTANKN